jgi:hypothetical protein
VYQVEKELGGGRRSGKVEFKVTGDNYLENGRVLNWRVELYEGDVLLAHQQSYMWE